MVSVRGERRKVGDGGVSEELTFGDRRSMLKGFGRAGVGGRGCSFLEDTRAREER